jgi:hypothetical protein
VDTFRGARHFLSANSATPASGLFNASVVDLTTALPANDGRAQASVLIDPGTATRGAGYSIHSAVVDSAPLRRATIISAQRSAGGRATNLRLLGGSGGNISCAYVLEGLL